MLRPVDWIKFAKVKSGAYLMASTKPTNRPPERSYEILRKNRSILRPQKGRFLRILPLNL